MKRRPRQKQLGFTIVELVISMCILAVLASIAIKQLGDYTKRARVSEVLMAASACKTAVQENYPVFDSPPPPGRWGCEDSFTSTHYASAVQTSADGAIRITLQNLGQGLDGQQIYMVPARADGETAMTTSNDLGSGVRAWICGSDFMLVRNALPANCRSDTTTFSSNEYGP